MMDRKYKFHWCLGLLVMPLSVPSLAGPIAAEEVSILPDLAVAAKDLGDERKYIVFHKPGVSAEQAASDLSYCYTFLPHGVSRRAPAFVPWTKAEATKKVVYGGGNYGLVGFGIAAIIDGPLERSIRQSRLYQCMIPRGYDRYRTSEKIWKLLNDGNTADGIMLQAQIASGPTPPTPRVQP